MENAKNRKTVGEQMAERHARERVPFITEQKRQELLADRLRQLRAQSYMTLEQVAKALGVTYQCIQRYENGKSKPSLGKLQQIARVYGVSIESLMDTHMSPESLDESAELQRRLSGFRQYTKERANAIYAFAMEILGMPGVVHSFLDDATVAYLRREIDDDTLYVHAKAQVERMAQLMLTYHKRKEQKGGESDNV